MSVQSFYSSLDDITVEHGGILRCMVCGSEQPVESRYWREGWPKCCGYTIRWITARQLRDGL